MHRIEKTEKRMKENCGKIENILNLALDATQEEREKSLNLDVGYDVTENRWEVIVKFLERQRNCDRSWRSVSPRSRPGLEFMISQMNMQF